MTQPTPAALAAAQRIADAMAGLPGVVAMSLGGSAASGFADAASDLDVYVYWRAPLADPDQRAERLLPLADAGSMKMNLLTWGLEDHLHVDGTLIELVYFNLDDLVADVARAYGEGSISNAYTTALLYTLATNHMLHDSTGEATSAHTHLNATYPEATRRKLMHEHPTLLRYSLTLLRRARQRNDLLYVQQMRYEVQATFFDLLFALNRRYNPGGKRLLLHAQCCALQPPATAERWNHIARIAADDAALPDALESLINDLCVLAEAYQ